MITANHSIQIARYLISECGDADSYRALYLEGELTPEAIDQIHSEEILSRWGRRYSDAIDDCAYNNAMFYSLALIYDKDEPNRLKKAIANLFLSAAWQDIELFLSNAEAENIEDKRGAA